MAATCPKCSAATEPADRFCSACGEPLAEAARTPPPATLTEPRNLARVAQAVALLGFVLPWITVSCQDRVLAQVSGLDMALGRVTIHNPFTDVSQVHASSPNAVVVVALALIVAGLALSFSIAIRRIALANVLGSAAALLLVGYEVLVSAGGSVRAQAAAHRDTGDVARSFAEAVRVTTDFGFWLTCADLVAAIWFYWQAQADRGGTARVRPPPPPEPRSNAAGPPPG